MIIVVNLLVTTVLIDSLTKKWSEETMPCLQMSSQVDKKDSLVESNGGDKFKQNEM